MDGTKTQFSNNIVKTVLHVNTMTSVSAVLAVLGLAFSQYVTPWVTAAMLSNAASFLVPGIVAAGLFIASIVMDVRADEYRETHTVAVRKGGSTGVIVETANAYKYYHTVRISDTAGRFTTVATMSQYDGVWSGYEACQAVHRGGDATE